MLIGAISLNSNYIINYNLMKFINFFNNSNLIILGGSLGLILLGLLILYKNYKNNNLDTSLLSNTSSSSDASSSLSSTNNLNNDSNNESHIDGRERIYRARNYGTGTFGVTATVITALEGVPTMIGIGTSLGFGMAVFMLGYNLNSDQKESQVQINRIESPPQDINLSNLPENAVKVLDINLSNLPENPYNVLSSNEDENNLLNLI